MKALAVSLPGHSVGALSQDRSGLVAFAPDEAWERGGQMPRLGLDFLRRPGPREDANDLPAWFANLLPERESALRARLSAAFSLREGQSFELLRALGGDLIGAVAVTGSPHDGVPHPKFTESTATASQSEDDAPMSALTGNQLKLAMSRVGDRLALPAHTKDRHYIVKFAGADYPELAEVEDATMAWASAAGFAVPEHFSRPFEKVVGIPPEWGIPDAPVFAVRRFDRRPDGTRIHQEDLCQALDLRPGQKYGNLGSRGRVTTENALRLVVDACGEADGREMARRLGFAIASGNTDAHLKNWSLVWGEGVRPTLSPCYDLVTTIAWDKLGWKRRRGPTLALPLGGVEHFAQLSDEALDAATARAGHPWLRDELLAGIARAFEAWPRVNAPERMRDALAVHWRRVPLLARRPTPKT